MAENRETTSGQEVSKGKLRVDYTRADARHAMVCLIQSTADEVVVDFASHPLPSVNKSEISIAVHTRIGMSYPAAKRLLMLLGGAITRYEKVFGNIEADARKRTTELRKKGGEHDDGTAKIQGST